jgi:hypothetical protein
MVRIGDVEENKDKRKHTQIQTFDGMRIGCRSMILCGVNVFVCGCVNDDDVVKMNGSVGGHDVDELGVRIDQEMNRFMIRVDVGGWLLFWE